MEVTSLVASLSWRYALYRYVFRQIRCGSSPGGTPFIFLGNRQVSVGKLEILGYFRPALIVGIDIVRQIIITFLVQRLIIGNDYLLENAALAGNVRVRAENAFPQYVAAFTG